MQTTLLYWCLVKSGTLEGAVGGGVGEWHVVSTWLCKTTVEWSALTSALALWSVKDVKIGSNVVRLATNGTNPGLSHIQYKYMSQNVLKSVLKSSFLGADLTNFCAKLDITGMWWGDHHYLGHKQAERGGKVSLTEGDRERRKNIRNVGPLDSALWSANHSEESNGSTFRLLFLFSRSPCSNCIHYWPNKENLKGWQIFSPHTFSLILLDVLQIYFFCGI